MRRIDLELARRCETAELAASRSRYDAVPKYAALALGAGARPLGAAQIAFAKMDVLMMNMVLGLGVEAPATEAELDEALRFYEERNAVRCMVSLAPCAEPAELAQWLEARHFYRHGHWLRLARDVSPLPHSPARFDVEVFGRERADEFSAVVGEAFGFPAPVRPMLSGVVECDGWHHFGAFEGSLLVGAAGMFVHGDMAWFGTAGTRLSHRGRGAQSALIAARIDYARGIGCKWITVETGPDTDEKPNPSTHNLRRLGFVDLYERPNWVKVLRDARD